MAIDLDNRKTVQAIRSAAAQMAFYSDHQNHKWFHRAYLDLQYAADILDAMLARAQHGLEYLDGN